MIQTSHRAGGKIRSALIKTLFFQNWQIICNWLRTSIEVSYNPTDRRWCYIRQGIFGHIKTRTALGSWDSVSLLGRKTLMGVRDGFDLYGFIVFWGVIISEAPFTGVLGKLYIWAG